MEFIKDKYYLCVDDYILNDVQIKQKKHNQFLEYMSLVENKFRTNSSRIYDNSVKVPNFIIGHFYKCVIPGHLRDEHWNHIMISNENTDNFLLLDVDAVIDSYTHEFIKRAKSKYYIEIEIRPYMIWFDSTIATNNSIKGVKSIDDLNILFKISANGHGFSYYSTFLYNDENDTRNAVYDIWKKVRNNSGICRLIRKALDSTSNKSKKMYYSLYNKYNRSNPFIDNMDDWM